MIKSILNLKNGEEISFPKNALNISITIVNEEDSLVLKFPFHTINSNNSGLYSQSIVRFFMKDEQRKEALLKELLNEAEIEIIQNKLFVKEGSRVAYQYNNLDLGNIEKQDFKSKITTKNEEEKKKVKNSSKVLNLCNII